MIYGVTGLLGGGKSYGCVKMGLEHMAKGGVWATNIVINIEAAAVWCRLPPDVVGKLYYNIDPDVNPDCYSWPRGDSRGRGKRRVMVTIDEAGEWFSNLADGGKGRMANFTSWLRQSDKRGQDVYLIVQDASILAKQGRVLAHRWIYFRNMRNWKIPKVGWGLPPPWCYEFHKFEYDSTGKNSIGKEISMTDRRIYHIYDTSAMFGQSAKESTGVFAYENGVEIKSKFDKDLAIALCFSVVFWFVLVLIVGVKL